METLTETLPGRMFIPEAYVGQYEYNFADEIKGWFTVFRLTFAGFFLPK